MAAITPEIARQQQKICFRIFFLGLVMLLSLSICVLFLIKIALQAINIDINSYYFWLAFLPMPLIFMRLLANRPIMFDWLAFYVMSIPLSFLYIAFSAVCSFVYLPESINSYVSLWMLISFITVLFFRARAINYISVKKNLLKYNIDLEKGLYAPRLNGADIGELYKKTKNDVWLDKVKVMTYTIIISIGPILIGISMSSAGSDNLKMIGGCILLYLISMVGGIYAFLLYYTRLKCLYQIQKELGRKLRFF